MITRPKAAPAQSRSADLDGQYTSSGRRNGQGGLVEFWIGTAIAVVSLVVAVAALAWQKRGGAFKRIHYTAYCEPFLMDRSDDAYDNFNQGPLSVHLEPSGFNLVWPMAFKLKLANTGRGPILPSDFAGPMSINFGELCRFVGGAIEVNRGAIDDFIGSDSLELREGVLKVDPFLLNPGDQITLSGILNGIVADEGITISGRVAGVETFVRLEPDSGGITMQVNGTSLVRDFTEPQGACYALNGMVLIMPKFLPLSDIAPDGEQGRAISTRINGQRVDDLHQVSFILANESEQPFDAMQEITFHAGSAPFLHLLRVSVDGFDLPRLEANEIVNWDARVVRIRVDRIRPRSTLTVNIICRGDAGGLMLTERPSVLGDIQIARARIAGDPLGKKLLDMEPRVLLLSRRVHRKFHLKMPRTKELAQRVRELKQRVLHGD
ncbi:hypothetical protein [Streptomyces sp. NBC_00878]|uniref:hypothetical protein n=1 Tax=Streptomyces sp. NBC_00878 TaxID=2975854 RepID=UPI0022555411|nr:hypothetical protein [Streptomyces sp. NBC_00878]MCX4907637.1 hypothetical protein [Streptomyces sp. NBC_00878]